MSSAETMTVLPDSASAVEHSALPLPREFSGRRAILIFVFLSLALALARLLTIDGWLRPIVIEGPSMALTLKNEHYQITCADCGYTWTADGTVSIPEAGWWCPNCAELQSHPLFTALPADHVAVDRWPLLAGDPNRWEVVALMAPAGDTAEEQATIKRVIGLPGEQVSIRDGDIWIDGNRPLRTLTQWRKTAVLIHDDNHRLRNIPGVEAVPRWQPESKDGGWQTLAKGYQFMPRDDATTSGQIPEMQRLVYQHLRQRRGTTITKTFPLDDDTYNQDMRTLTEVRDLALSLKVQVAEGANLELVVHDGTSACRAFWSARDKEWSLYYGKSKLISVPYRWQARIPVYINWVRYDGAVVLVINGRTIARHVIDGIPLGTTETPSATPEQCASLGSSGGEIVVRDLKVFRDIHYLPPTTTKNAQTTWHLGVDDYFLLGDNPPVSLDSRHWPAQSIDREDIWGVVRQP